MRENYDFHVSLDEEKISIEWNYRTKATPLGRLEGWGGTPDLNHQGQEWVRYHDRYNAEGLGTGSLSGP